MKNDSATSSPKRSAIRIVSIYAFVSSMWILFSDQILSVVIRNVDTMTRLQMIKGWLFVIVTSILIYVLLSREIANYLRIESRLRASRSELQALMDVSPVAISWADKNEKILYGNNKFIALFGYGIDELPTVARWFEQVFPDPARRKEVRLQWENHLRDTVEDPGKAAPLEVEISCKDGTRRYVAVTGAVLANRILAVFNDLTDRRDAEEMMRQASKMEALGTLAGGIAHDFNNLLMGIQGNASLLLMDLIGHHEQRMMLENVETYVRSGVALTRQLLGLARSGKYEVAPADITEVIDASADMFARTHKEIVIHRRFASDVWPVAIDRGQIEQVLLNLFINAWQAMPGGGEIHLEAENDTIDDNAAHAHRLTPGRYVKVLVIDSGIGMDSATLEKAFDPFFTTKEKQRGTGLGLASAYGIINNHRGCIYADSRPGEGARFTILLPAVTGAVEKPAAAEMSWTPGTETLLLVDDEDLVRDVGCRILERIGYRVLTAGSGAEAVAMIEASAGDIQMVILDMIMPGMDGVDTFDRMNALAPEIPILLCSGYSLDEQAADLLDRGVRGFIQKPFTLQAIAGKIRDILDGDDRPRPGP